MVERKTDDLYLIYLYQYTSFKNEAYYSFSIIVIIHFQYCTIFFCQRLGRFKKPKACPTASIYCLDACWDFWLDYLRDSFHENERTVRYEAIAMCWVRRRFVTGKTVFVAAVASDICGFVKKERSLCIQ